MRQRSIIELLFFIFIIVVSVILKLKPEKEEGKNTNVYKMAQINGYVSLFFAVVFGFMIGKDIYVGKINWITIVIGVLGVSGCIALALYCFNRKIKIENEAVIYTNWLRKEKSYSIWEITEIRQIFGGDFGVYVRGKRAFVIDKQVPEAVKAIINASAELGRNLPLNTTASKQVRNFRNDELVSKTTPKGYLLVLVIIAIPAGMLVFMKGAEKSVYVMMIGLLVFTVWFFLYSCTIKIVYDPIRRAIRVRKFLVTREYVLEKYEKKIVEQNEKQTIIMLYDKQNMKKKVKVCFSYLMTNRELITEKIMETM